jgi:tetratricopeptide (TPR) repeat protein
LNRNRIAVSLALVLLVGSTFLGCEVPDKGTAEWHANQGYKLINDGCWDEAIEECNKAIELAPSLASAYNNRAWAYNKKGEYDLAISDCKRVTQLCPGLADAYINEAYAYKEKGQYDLFVDCCSEAIGIDANLTMPNLELFDFELQRILEALARAIEYKNEATLIINDIEQQTKQALSLISECQQPDPSLLRPMLPMFSVLAPIDSSYMMGRSCDCYSSNAEIAGNNAESHFDRVIRILSEVNRCWNFINNLCSSIGLSDSEKSYLEDALYSFERDAQAEANDFDRFISDIKEFLEDYVICIEEGNIIGEPPLGSTTVP